MTFDRYIGLPYAESGRGPAFDCWGLVRHVMAREFNVELPAYDYGEDRASRLRLIDEVRAGYEQIDGPQPGALVLMQHGNRRPHVGICLDDQWVLHTRRETGALLERLNGPQVRNAIAGYYLPHPRAS